MNPIQRPGYAGLLVSLLLLLAACDSSSGTTDADTTPPSARIQFPPTLNALTDHNTVLIRGTASDAHSGVDSVVVNGLPARSEDGFAHWSVEVPLMEPGIQPITVAVLDQAGNRDSIAAQVRVNSQPNLLIAPSAVAFNSVNNRALVAENLSGTKALLAVNLDTGNRTVISSNAGVGDGVAFGFPRSIALDSANNRALVADSSLQVLLAVDLSTGERTVASGTTTDNNKGTGRAFVNLRAVALDSANKRALVMDSGLDALLAVDLSTGNRTVISDASTGNDDASFDTALEIAVDSAGERALVVDNIEKALLAVNLETGERTVISNGTIGDGDAFKNPVAVAFDSANNRALVVDTLSNALLAVDLRTGERTVISNGTNIRGDDPFDPSAIALDSANNRVLVLDKTFAALLAVDLDTGERTSISTSNAAFIDWDTLPFPYVIALDSAHNRMLVLNFKGTFTTLVAVDLSTGERTLISDDSTAGDGDQTFDLPQAMVLDNAHNRALVVDLDLQALLAVDLGTGERSVISSSNAGIGDGVAFVDPQAIALDSANNRVFVVDSNLQALVAVDLNTGDRRVFSDATTGDGVAFGFPQAIVLDKAHNRALVVNYVVDNDFNVVDSNLLAVDLDTGDRTSVSIGDDDTFISELALDSAGNRALLLDNSAQTLLAVDLSTDESIVIWDAALGWNGVLQGDFLDSIAYDSVNDQLLAIGVFLNFGTLLAVDLESGDRVVLTQ